MQQPPYPYQQQPRPGRIRRLTNWYRRQRRALQVVIGIGILACCLCVCSAAVSDVIDSANTPAATPTVTGAQSAQASTDTPAPTPKPTATLTASQRVQKLVSDNASDAKSIKTTYTGNDVEVNITLNEQLDQSDARSTIQQNCFQIEQALWTGHIAKLDDVNIAFSGPATDKFGNVVTVPYGECDLGHASAAKFNWAGLTQQSAWQAYDLARFYAIIQG